MKIIIINIKSFKFDLNVAVTQEKSFDEFKIFANAQTI